MDGLLSSPFQIQNEAGNSTSHQWLSSQTGTTHGHKNAPTNRLVYIATQGLKPILVFPQWGISVLTKGKGNELIKKNPGFPP